MKRLLPRTLFGRTMLILVTPFILVQGVATWFFYDRLWDTLARRLSADVAGEIAMTLEARRLVAPDQTIVVDAFANQSTGLGFRFLPDAALPAAPPSSNSAISDQLDSALRHAIRQHYQIEERAAPAYLLVAIQMPDGVLQVSVPRKRLFTSNTYIFFMWMTGTGIVTVAVASLFLKNQVRSLRRLAAAAEAFGKGREVPDFRPEGAAEVRQAAAAFLLMRARIQRQISQRTEMLSGVSHDLRTPLTRMKLELEMLGDGEDVRGLKADVAEMERMVEGYLSFARGEGSEATALNDLGVILSEAVATERRAGTDVILSGPTQLMLPVRREALRRCLMNLLVNAGRYAQRCWVSLVPLSKTVEIWIDDDGPGIPPEHREAVFRPFYRLEMSRNQETGGIGLGLTIARDIMLSHGGNLILETSPQGGLRARLILPR